MLFCIGEAASDPFRLKSLNTSVIEVHLKAIKVLAFSGGADLFKGPSPAP